MRERERGAVAAEGADQLELDCLYRSAIERAQQCTGAQHAAAAPVAVDARAKAHLLNAEHTTAH